MAVAANVRHHVSQLARLLAVLQISSAKTQINNLTKELKRCLEKDGVLVLIYI